MELAGLEPTDLLGAIHGSVRRRDTEQYVGENIELARKAMEVFNRGDWEGAVEWCDPDVEYVVARERPAARTLHGRAEVRAYWLEWRETVGTFTFDITEARPVGDRLVLAGRMRGRGAASGAELEVSLAFVATMRDGRAVHPQEYLDRDEALEAAGLSESGGGP